MTIYQSLDEIRTWIARRDWEGLEAKFRTRCAQIDTPAADRIAAVQLAEYERDLRASIERLQSARLIRVQAWYWEFSPDNHWESAFFPCLSYEREAVGNDDWASNFDDSSVVAGPAAPAALAAEFATDWDGTQASAARNVYLVARTIATFGRASSTWTVPLPLCAGYHDQEHVYRVVGE